MIMHIVGNRPQFIKLAPVSKEFHKRGCQQVTVHTGQHYDGNMSDIFFQQLGIPKPARNLAIGSGSHAEMTGKAMIEIEKALREYLPKCVILYGDTDSTLAGALATAKMNIPIAHIEAGVRTGVRANPEEINRVVTDQLSDILFCPDEESMGNLAKEGLSKNAFQVGDVMYDTFLQYKNSGNLDVLSQYGLQPDSYVLMTWHRQENTSSKERMQQIIRFLGEIKKTVICPMHPRTKAKLMEYQLDTQLGKLSHVCLLNPVGYFEMVSLMSHAHIILTDSGGVSKESYFAGVGCILMVDLNLWPDLIKNHWITKLDFNSDESRSKALRRIAREKDTGQFGRKMYYGDGHACAKIADCLGQRGII